MEKKRKAEEKRNRRKERKAAELASSQDSSDEETLAQTPIENAPADGDAQHNKQNATSRVIGRSGGVYHNHRVRLVA